MRWCVARIEHRRQAGETNIRFAFDDRGKTL